MTKYKVIYKGIIYNCLAMSPILNCGAYVNGEWVSTPNHIDSINIIYINEENRVATLEDKVDEFQFILK